MSGFRNQLLTRLIVANSVITSQGMFFYNGTPALGNLIQSTGVAAAGTDAYGNAYLAGDTVYVNLGAGTGYVALNVFGVAVTWYFANTGAGPWVQDTTLSRLGVNQLALTGSVVINGIPVPAAPAAGKNLLFSDVNGFLQTRPGLAGDTNVYNLGAVHLHATATPQTISSTSGAIVTGLSLPVGIGTYHVRARIIGKVGATAGGQNLNFSGPVISAGHASCISLGEASSVIGVADSAAIGGNMPTGTFAANVVFVSHMEAWYTFTAAGMLSLQASEGTNLDTWTVQDGMMSVWPAN